ncbi:MAG TPA: hypothetical protein PKY82_01420 [Pyrinomonadaceae bacterium]|nr:hypothetical protein [Pyrinomonadaceae bacterium]
MKHHSTILVLAFLLVAFPVSFKSQTHKSRVKTQKVKQNSDEVQAKEIVKQLIDGFFVKRKFLPVFQKLFVPCNKIDKKISQLNCGLQDIYPFKFGRQIGFKTMQIGWREVFEEYYFVLGTYPINKDIGKESVESHFFYCEDFDNLRTKVFKKNNASPLNFNFDFFTNLNKKQIEEKNNEIERNVNEIEQLVFNRIDNTLYKRNLEIMRKTIKITPIIENNRKYYLAEIENFIMGFFLTKRNGHLKIVGIGMKDND